MSLVTPKGIEARRLAREVLESSSDMLTSLHLIEHATSPRFNDDAYHENAHEIAVLAIAKSKNQHAMDTAEVASV